MSFLIDGIGRRITYVRLSVTDRCNLRCRYCMAEQMSFLPRVDLLTLDEIERLADILISRGVNRIRLTGGEPLVRRGILDLVASLGRKLGSGLDEITLTTNGTRLRSAAEMLHAGGVRRVNVSLDTLDAARFARITRRGDINQVLGGIDAASAVGLAVKINMVALQGENDDEIEPMMRWCASRGFDLTLIETMPLGEVEEHRADRYLPLDAVRSRLEERLTLLPSVVRTGGPARYFDVQELGLRLGLITPMTNNFCAGCNRIRVDATGTVYGCLGHDQKIELRDHLRAKDDEAVERALGRLIAGKPQRHAFDIASKNPATSRHMSVTGG